MSSKGSTGISFPFRIGVKGGVVTSTTDVDDIQHITEAMTQILGTHRFERSMEYHFHSDVAVNVFSPNNPSTRTLLVYQIKEALSALEDRIAVSSVDVIGQDNTLYAVIRFRVLQYNTIHVSKVKVGDINANENVNPRY